jgi:serine protease Do
MLDQLQETAERIAQDVWRSVVRIGDGERAGSGVLLSSGHIVTNAHNVRRGALAVHFSDGHREQLTVAGMDIDGDLAVLATASGPGNGLARAEDPARIGQPIFTIAAAGSGPRVTFGLVSATDQPMRGPRGLRIAGSIEHTAPMAPGSSGSPLVDRGGQLLGLNTSRVGNGFYRALPADAAFQARVEMLAAGRSVERPRLGVTVAPPRAASRMRAAVGLPPRAGILVREVEDGSAAARAGIVAGDLIVAVDGQPVDDPDDLAAALEPARELRIDVVRGERELAVSATPAA